MDRTITYTEELAVVTCWCGMAHAVPAALREYQLRKHRDGIDVDVYCPRGHSYGIAGKSEAAKERERRVALEAQLRSEKDQHQAERRAHAATKASLTKARRRADRGVCQHCHRSFVDVARHVRSKHPDEVGAGGDGQ